MEDKTGILYDNGKVFLAGRENLTKLESFKTIKGLAELAGIVISKIRKENEEVANVVKKTIVNAFRFSYLSIMSSSNIYKSILNSFYDGIEDDRFVFEIKPEENWKAYIVVEPTSVKSLINMIMYCMITMCTEFTGDIEYILKDVDIIKEFDYQEEV